MYISKGCPPQQWFLPSNVSLPQGCAGPVWPCLGGGKGTLSLLAYERLVDVGDDAAPGDGGLNQRVQLLVPADSELQHTM